MTSYRNNQITSTARQAERPECLRPSPESRDENEQRYENNKTIGCYEHDPEHSIALAGSQDVMPSLSCVQITWNCANQPKGMDDSISLGQTIIYIYISHRIHVWYIC